MDENQESETDDNQEPDEDEYDEEISILIEQVERLTAENAALIARIGECESSIAQLREHKHEPEPEPEPERLPEPEPIPTESHFWFRRIGGSAT